MQPAESATGPLIVPVGVEIEHGKVIAALYSEPEGSSNGNMYSLCARVKDCEVFMEKKGERLALRES
jgi:hypothetical protein